MIWRMNHKDEQPITVNQLQQANAGFDMSHPMKYDYVKSLKYENNHFEN